MTSEIYQVGGHVATRQTTFACLDFVVVVVSFLLLHLFLLLFVPLLFLVVLLFIFLAPFLYYICSTSSSTASVTTYIPVSTLANFLPLLRGSNVAVVK